VACSRARARARLLVDNSVEYLPVTERIAEDGVLEVSSARLIGVSVVDSPAFPSATVEARAERTGPRPRRRRRLRWWVT
jgi:phage head maturation protease